MNYIRPFGIAKSCEKRVVVILKFTILKQLLDGLDGHPTVLCIRDYAKKRPVTYRVEDASGLFNRARWDGLSERYFCNKFASM